MKNESLYLVFLGLALTFLMGTTLFVLMGINPKASSYEMLPWVYAAGCATISAVTAALSRHFDRQPVATAVRVSGERHSRA